MLNLIRLAIATAIVRISWSHPWKTLGFLSLSIVVFVLLLISLVNGLAIH